MTTPFLHDYACGLDVHIGDGRKVIHHSGTIDGFKSYLACYPQEKLVVAVLSNLMGSGKNRFRTGSERLWR